MKKIFALLLLFAALHAKADELAVLSLDQAKKTFAFFKENSIEEAILWCACCSNDPKKKIKVSNYYYKGEKDSPGFYRFYIEGKTDDGEKIEESVDLAYVHIRFNNKAICLGTALNFKCDPCTQPFDWEEESIPLTGEDANIQKNLSEILEHYPTVIADVRGGIVTLTGQINKDELTDLIQKVHRIKPKQVFNNLTIGDKKDIKSTDTVASYINEISYKLQQANRFFNKRQYSLAQNIYKEIDVRDLDESAIMNIAYMNFEYGIQSNDRNWLKSSGWFENLANKGNSNAMFFLARFFYTGINGVQADASKARFWYEKSANLGNASAMHDLADFYKYGTGGLSKNFQMAKYWLEKSAKLGNVWGIYGLGFLYEQGDGVAKDFQTARYWYKKGCELEGGWACCEGLKRIAN